MFDLELTEQIKDTLALSGADPYDRQVNAQMREFEADCAVGLWTVLLVLGIFIGGYVLLMAIALAATSGSGRST